ncbi:MAG: TonB-dependent receptor [Candidatus Omnitrophota bacterium]|nr:MAG: TonB-dependent receptor [Candidatus Omnitrophota bacterium]
MQKKYTRVSVMKIAFIIFIFLSFFLSLAFCQTIQLEKITVEKYRDFPVAGIESLYLQDFPQFSTEEIIDYSSSIDLRKRSPFGVQQDVSLRGSIFEDTAIHIGGIEVNDPQTGHFNLEIPLTSADIENVEIVKNAQAINFTLKEPQEEGLFLKASFGQHALWEELLSLNFPLGKINNRLSVEHKISSGARQDTDFEIYNFSSHSLWQASAAEIEFLFGSTERDFGAGSFYSAALPQAEEHTNQRFFSLRAGLKGDLFDLNNNLYFRRHGDKFIYNRNNPLSRINDHTTYVYGLQSNIVFNNDAFLKLNIEREKITSTNLDDHRRLKKGFSLGVKEKKFGDFIFALEAGLDYYENWEYLENIHVHLGYCLKDNSRLRFSFDRIWRAPSFTELYYNDTFYNIGNRNLTVQKSNNFELGLDYSCTDNFSFSISSFLRNQDDTIDWVKNNSQDPWQAENVGDLTFYGFDFYLEAGLEDCLLEEISLGYTYLNSHKKNPSRFSKYVFDYNSHKLVSNFGFNIKDILLHVIVNFSHPLERKKYTTVDLKVEKKIEDFTLILEGVNIFNKDFQELQDIESTGRWYKISVAYDF